MASLATDSALFQLGKFETMQRPKPSFLFDLDGTLVDSVYQHVLSWHEALEAEGIPQDRHERRPVDQHAPA